MQVTDTLSPSPFGNGYSAQRYANERAIMARPQGAQLAAWRQTQQGASSRAAQNQASS